MWFLFSIFRHKKWLTLSQCFVSLCVAWLICGSWYQNNWLTIITSALSANSVGKIEGDPAMMSLLGWLWYLKLLPSMISIPLFIEPLGIALVYGGKKLSQRIKNNNFKLTQPQRNLLWILLFIGGSYFLCSLGTNKDDRFIMPYLIPRLAPQ